MVAYALLHVCSGGVTMQKRPGLRRTSAIAAAAILATAAVMSGCSSSHPSAKSEPRPSPSPSPSAGPVPKPSPASLTQAEAGALYLRLIAPVYAAKRRYNAAGALPQQLAAISGIVSAERSLSVGLLRVPWPADVQPTVAQYTRDLAQEQTVYDSMAQSTSSAELDSYIDKLIATGAIGDGTLLREQLGLPAAPGH